MFTQKIIESFKAGDDNLGLLVLHKFGREIVDFDKRTGNRILYWSIVTETRAVGETSKACMNTILDILQDDFDCGRLQGMAMHGLTIESFCPE